MFEEYKEAYEILSRIKKAQDKKYVPIKLDCDAQTASFKGSGKELYNTTPSSCTCLDFATRHQPCKHMYRLQIELGLLDTKELIPQLNQSQYTAYEEAMAILSDLVKYWIFINGAETNRALERLKVLKQDKFCITKI